jgi:C-terminal processing protease CtpA/Prc
MRWNYQGISANTLQVMYVVPGSPAEKAGIRRGDLFCRYNGTQITEQNVEEIYNLPEVTLTRTDGTYNRSNRAFTPIGTPVTVAKGAYYDTPVLCDTVYRMDDGKNIGYLFYGRFESAKGTPDDPDLRAAIGRMKAKNVDELILDLRYNGGGYIDISVQLATMLLPAQYGKNDVYLYQEYSPKKDPRQHPLLFSGNVDAYRLDLERLHVIVTYNSASASEITVHGLEQYMPVTLYGMQTRGKNVGSYEIPGKGGNVPWNIYPISSHIYDRRGKNVDNWQTFTGLTPDYSFDEIEGGAYYFQGQLGRFDPSLGADCDPLLNFVMARLGYAEQFQRKSPTRSASGGTPVPVPHFTPSRPQVLIVDSPLQD